MIEHEEDGVWLVLTERIAVHHEDIFAALTTGNGLARWLCIDADIDLRHGGTIEFYWDEKRRSRTSRAILAYDAGGEITWDWIARSDDVHAPVYWKVEPSVEEGCVVTLRQGPFANSLDGLELMVDEATYWQWHLCNLRTTFEGSMDLRRHRPL